MATAPGGSARLSSLLQSAPIGEDHIVSHDGEYALDVLPEKLLHLRQPRSSRGFTFFGNEPQVVGVVPADKAEIDDLGAKCKIDGVHDAGALKDYVSKAADCARSVSHTVLKKEFGQGSAGGAHSGVELQGEQKVELGTMDRLGYMNTKDHLGDVGSFFLSELKNSGTGDVKLSASSTGDLMRVYGRTMEAEGDHLSLFACRWSGLAQTSSRSPAGKICQEVLGEEAPFCSIL
eukprot:TRINITY_DN40546_c0_g1_i1.p1 TRINITY_DN40546_c0_g1~~TRINITY_DN40546_c0_g1_i1.p1  ORF type:complete len:233 (-),score=36.73 TRINITY_DN40546_c0_g1_i1:165-863(-)